MLQDDQLLEHALDELDEHPTPLIAKHLERLAKRPGLSDDDTTELVRIIARLRKDAGDFTDPRPLPDPL